MKRMPQPSRRSPAAPPPPDDEPEPVKLHKFNFTSFKPDRIVMLVGKRGTGKSVLLNDLLSYLSLEYDMGIAMSPTPESQDMFREFMPDSCIYDEYDGDKIAEVVDTLRRWNHRKVYRRVFVLLDDCMFDPRVLRSTAMRDIHMNGRHLKILFLNIVQYVMDVPKSLRSQIDYVFALREPQRAYRESLYKNFFGVFGTYDEFAVALDTCTSNYGCMVIDNTSSKNDPSSSVFWYRAVPKPPKFILGNSTYWKLHYLFYNEPDTALRPDEDLIPCLARNKPSPPSSEKQHKEHKSSKRRGKKGPSIVVDLVVEDGSAGPAPAAVAPQASSHSAPHGGPPLQVAQHGGPMPPRMTQPPQVQQQQQPRQPSPHHQYQQGVYPRQQQWVPPAAPAHAPHGPYPGVPPPYGYPAASPSMRTYSPPMVHGYGHPPMTRVR